MDSTVVGLATILIILGVAGLVMYNIYLRLTENAEKSKENKLATVTNIDTKKVVQDETVTKTDIGSLNDAIAKFEDDSKS